MTCLPFNSKHFVLLRLHLNSNPLYSLKISFISPTVYKTKIKEKQIKMIYLLIMKYQNNLQHY